MLECRLSGSRVRQNPNVSSSQCIPFPEGHRRMLVGLEIYLHDYNRMCKLTNFPEHSRLILACRLSIKSASTYTLACSRPVGNTNIITLIFQEGCRYSLSVSKKNNDTLNQSDILAGGRACQKQADLQIQTEHLPTSRSRCEICARIGALAVLNKTRTGSP